MNRRVTRLLRRYGRSSATARYSAWTPALLRRAIEVYESERIDVAQAYLVARAESTGVGKVASFERSIDRSTTIERIEPPAV
ncbi:hypothetical protein LAUMK4_02102 [Mycobacterium persicum]|uniref:Uncharacterized protein n=1 Tax=Mycobacterium persicum TaxID=1487726 RepID=A0ABY6RH37_9MYCO|nr:hypothetical protein A4G31_24535 [Mycobacterium persicum]VAZ74723.1 hypothetical protein LAUMK15_02425 [Mycobacterium persicum]VAZ92473.1 hypothetical protein LAUMK4_02102 [Mycobacterium persicum]